SIRARRLQRNHAWRCNDARSRYTSEQANGREVPMSTNSESGTNVHEIAAGIFRINTPAMLPGEVGFSFNQYLIVDDEPLLFHTGMRGLYPLVSEAIRAVMPLERLRYV